MPAQHEWRVSVVGSNQIERRGLKSVGYALLPSEADRIVKAHNEAVAQMAEIVTACEDVRYHLKHGDASDLDPLEIAWCIGELERVIALARVEA